MALRLLRFFLKVLSSSASLLIPNKCSEEDDGYCLVTNGGLPWFSLFEKLLLLILLLLLLLLLTLLLVSSCARAEEDIGKGEEISIGLGSTMFLLSLSLALFSLLSSVTSNTNSSPSGRVEAIATISPSLVLKHREA